MRIAWFGPMPTDGGGVSGMATLVLAGLLDLGHSVDMYVAGEPAPFPQRLAGRERLRARFSYADWGWTERLKGQPALRFAVNQSGRATAMRRLGAAVEREHARAPYDVVYQFSQIEMFALRTRLDRLPPVVLHPETHLAGELYWYRREAALSRRCEPAARRAFVRALLTVRSRVQRAHIGDATLVICPSAAFRDHLVADYGVPRDRCRVVANPIDLERFRVRTPPERDRRAVVFVGRISVRKGVDLLVELSHRLARRGTPVRMQLIGGETMWSDYRPLLGDLEPTVAEAVGTFPPDLVASRLGRADLAIQPSKYEPFGLTAAEALASGTPLLATTEVGAAEGIDPDAGEVVAADDIEALEAGLLRLLARLDAGDGPAMRAAARASAERLFDPALIAKQVADVLAEAAGGPPPPRSL
jgi:glycosyltransferase involved in cell wall biosynthesis